MSNPRQRPDYGKRPRVDNPPQGTPFTRGFYTQTILHLMNTCLENKQLRKLGIFLK